MRLRHITLLLLILVSAVASAQIAPSWAVKYDNTYHMDGKTKLAVDAQGNTYVTGASATDDTAQDFLTVKYSPTGARLWFRRWNNPKVNFHDQPSDIRVDSQGNVIVVGTTWNDVNSGPNTGTEFDIVVLKYSPGGQLLWQKQWDDPIHFQDFGNAVRIDSKDNVIVMGWANSRSTNPNFPNYLNNDFLTLKYSPAGSLLWTRTYNGKDQMADGGNDITLDGADNIYVTGTSKRWNGGAIQDMLTLKYNPAGTLLWTANNPGRASIPDNANMPRSIKVDVGGNVYVAAWDVVTEAPRDVLLIKYNPNGSVAWKRNWSRTGEDVVYDMVLDSQGNPILAVSTEPVPGKGFPDSDALLLKYSPSGALLWQRIYNGPSSMWDGDNLVTVDAQDNILMGIQSQSVSYDFTVLKYSPSGVLNWVWKYDTPERKDDMLLSMALDSSGLLHLTGETNTPNKVLDYLTLVVNPAQIQPVVVPDPQKLTFSAISVAGGQDVTATVRLTSPAPVGGCSMKIMSNNTDVAYAQGWVDITQNNVSKSFTIHTVPGRSKQSVTISVTYNGKTVTGTFQVG